VRKGLVALALVFLAAHLPFLPPTLEDIDSINFALGVRDFDVARHQPHPPGYPIFIALGKISTPLVRAAGVPAPEPRALALWSTIAGTALIFLLFAMFRALDGASQTGAESSTVDGEYAESALAPLDTAKSQVGVRPREDARDRRDRRAWWATVVVALSPIFWFAALRPLTDMSGLAAAVAAQALLLAAIGRRDGSPTLTMGRRDGSPTLTMGRRDGPPTPTNLLRGGSSTLLWGAFVAGFAIGVRSQTFLLTLPLLALALVTPKLGLRTMDRVAAVAAAALGVIAWGVPLIIASGGWEAYAAALGSQAGEDFSGVVMLWTTRTPRVALDAVVYSVLWPWGHPIAGGVAAGLAVIGGLRVGWKSPRVLLVLLIATVPYAVFHLLFQETVTVRYALPLVVPMAYLMVRALDWGRGVLPAGAIAFAMWSLILSVPAAATYGRDGNPAFRAFATAATRGPVVPGAPRPAAIGMHAVARRAADILAGDLPPVLEAPHGREWLALIELWRADARAHAWFVADPRRTDLALFDPASRDLVQTYRWGFVEPPFVGGARPGASDLYWMRPPGWMLDRGWALTAEVAGVTARGGGGPHRRPSVAWVKPRPDGATLVIGGRHLGATGDPAVRVMLAINGSGFASFESGPGFFFQVISVPAGALGGGSSYVPVDVTSRAADGSASVIAVGLEQFDLQPDAVPMVGAQEGWQESEYDPRTARSWRWTTERATLWVRPIGRDVTLTLRGESPLRYYDAAPVVTVTAGGREVARFTPSSDFVQDVVLPAEALASADGRVVIASDKWFAPRDRDGSADRRHLALRIFSYSVR